MSGRTEARQSRVRALLAEGGFYEMEEQARRPPPPPPRAPLRSPRLSAVFL